MAASCRYGGTFLVFSDYARPAIRLAALMGARVIYVMTHDSIGLGEDGPTHQPVEHLAALRAIPQSAGVPPGRRDRDGRMLAARARAPRRADGAGADPPEPAAAARGTHRREPAARTGAYELCRADGAAPRSRSSPPARRSQIAMRGARAAAGQGRRGPRRVGALLRAVPRASRTTYRAQGHRHRPGQGRASRRRCAWAGTRSSAPDGVFVGMTASAPAAPIKDVYQHFGITAEAVVDAAMKRHRRLTGRAS